MGSDVTVAAVVVSTIATILIGAYGMRVARTTSDFFVASRSVKPMWNASAISGEYLSAASFLGVAGLVLKHGVDALWYPVGFAAGYLPLPERLRVGAGDACEATRQQMRRWMQAIPAPGVDGGDMPFDGMPVAPGTGNTDFCVCVTLIFCHGLSYRPIHRHSAA